MITIRPDHLSLRALVSPLPNFYSLVTGGGENKTRRGEIGMEGNSIDFLLVSGELGNYFTYVDISKKLGKMATIACLKLYP